MKAMKPHILPTAILLALLCSCTSYHADYDIRLVKVTGPGGAEKRGAITGGDRTGFTFDDSGIVTSWIPSGYDINLGLENNTGGTLAVLWDRCFYIDEEGVRHRIIHSGTDLRDIGKPQDPTGLKQRKHEYRRIRPADYVIKSGDSWKSRPLFPFSGRKEKAVREEAERHVGKTFAVVLVFQKQNRDIESRFIFNVKGVKKVNKISTHF